MDGWVVGPVGAAGVEVVLVDEGGGLLEGEAVGWGARQAEKARFLAPLRLEWQQGEGCAKACLNGWVPGDMVRHGSPQAAGARAVTGAAVG